MHCLTEQDPYPNLCNMVAGVSESKRVDKVWRVRKGNTVLEMSYVASFNARFI
jgi:hypothetical protein